MTMLVAAPWPENVGQLQNMMERLVVTLAGDVIHASDLPAELAPRVSSRSAALRTLADVVEECEREAITIALEACKFHREKTAQRPGVSVRTLHYKMGRYGLH